MMTQRILCPVDFSPASREALATASTLARQTGATLYIVHVERSPLAFSPGMSGNFPNPADPESHLLWQTAPTSADVRFEHALLLGDPPTEILRYAADHDVQLIVMGTEGRSGISRLVMGSVAEAVSRRAETPVMMVKPQAVQAQLANAEEA